MKRVTVALLLCAFSVITFAGCGGGEEAPKKADTTAPAAGAGAEGGDAAKK